MLHVKLPEIFTDVVTQSFFRHPISKYAILQRPLRRIYFLSVGPGFWVNEVARVVPCQMLETIGSEPVIGLAAVCYNRRAWHNILMYQGEQFFFCVTTVIRTWQVKHIGRYWPLLQDSFQTPLTLFHIFNKI